MLLWDQLTVFQFTREKKGDLFFPAHAHPWCHSNKVARIMWMHIKSLFERKRKRKKSVCQFISKEKNTFSTRSAVARIFFYFKYFLQLPLIWKQLWSIHLYEILLHIGWPYTAAIHNASSRTGGGREQTVSSSSPDSDKLLRHSCKDAIPHGLPTHKHCHENKHNKLWGFFAAIRHLTPAPFSNVSTIMSKVPGAINLTECYQMLE